MKNKILGLIGIIWGGFICLSTGGGILDGKYNGEPSEIYAGVGPAIARTTGSNTLTINAASF